ncbi:hypothetical protein TeGR_g1075 [Tetraparma gracilis]|uniref:Uncharacterized protein n=1 Tax=Tetraparma gracilis TaxID=2962635 RepID=A0ABQ6MM53_9STRA|nr:hypothetical protein TeGR_g1075 [Tetraparma gracilis]
MPDSYIVNDKPEPLTIRVMYNAGNSGLFSFHQYPNSNPEKSVVVSEGGWGYPGYFQMLALKDADGEFALPKNCTELTVILDYRFVDEESSTGSMKMMQFSEMSPDKYTEEERTPHKFIWSTEKLIYPLLGSNAEPAQLSCASLFGFNCKGGDFSRANLRGSGMGFGNWSECKFEQADMRGCNAAQNNMTNADFNLAQCQGMVWNGAKIRGANFDGTYMENGKSLEKIREHDAVNWRTTYSIEGQDSDSDSDDEFEIAKGGEQVVSQTRALERQSSTVQSEKDRLKEYVVGVLNSDISNKLKIRTLLETGFASNDVEAAIDAVTSIVFLRDHFSNGGKNEVEYNDLDAELNKYRVIQAGVRQKLQKQKAQEFLDKIKAPTINYVQTAKASQMEKMKVFIKHGKRDPQELRRSADELRDVMTMLHELRGSFVSDTWMDQVDAWKELCMQQKGQSSERAMVVLRSIFEDKEVLRVLGMAEQFKKIRGKAPEGLLMKLKMGLGGHLKQNYILYKRALDDELNNIEFIEAQKQWVVALSGSALVAFMIGFSNLVSQLILNKMCFETSSSFCPSG